MKKISRKTRETIALVAIILIAIATIRLLGRIIINLPWVTLLIGAILGYAIEKIIDE